MNKDFALKRRDFLRTAAVGGAAAGLSHMFPAWAATTSHGAARKGSEVLAGRDVGLTISRHEFMVNGRAGHAIAMNGTIPGPLLRFREGEQIRIAVRNELDEDTSIHWHGLIVPFQMDGVPGISFPGIKARSTFVYEFPLKQAGTYWYHSHSGLQ
jgi:FtsP/CotA-like multicopper oxidase with cupredoxin domain